MKTRLLWLFMAVSACTTAKTIVPDDSKQVLTSHTQPFKVFGIGKWNKNYMILTLTDANNQYMVVQTREDATLKIGSIYSPE